jgi:hypothetical protein
VAVAGHHAYVADDIHGLFVVDVSAPGAPVIVGRLDTKDTATSVAVDGTDVYVTGLNAGLQVVDASSPESPAILGGLGSPGSSRDIAISGHHARCLGRDRRHWTAGSRSGPRVRRYARLPLGSRCREVTPACGSGLGLQEIDIAS